MREWLLIGLVVVSVPLVLKRPLWGMIIYLAANIIRPEMFFWSGNGGSYVFKVYYVLILAGMLYYNHFVRVGQVARREFFIMIWLLGAILLSIVLSQYPIYRGYYHVFELLKGFGICALLYILVNNFNDIKVVQNVLLGCFSFLAVWGFDQHIRGNERLEGLAGGSWADSNGIAAMFILFLPVALARVFVSKKRRQFWYSLGIVALMIALVVYTKSRSGLLGLITCIVMFGFYSRKVFALALISLLLLLTVLPFATQDYIDRMNTIGMKDSGRDRITLWKAGLMVFADNPLIGTGFLTYPEAKMNYESRFLELEEGFRQDVFRTENKKVTHNAYIQLLSDCGIIGATPFILLVGGGILYGFKARSLLRTNSEKECELLWLCGFSAGISGYAVCIMTIDAVLDILFYFQFAFASILYRKILEDEVIATTTDTPRDDPRLVVAGNF